MGRMTSHILWENMFQTTNQAASICVNAKILAHPPVHGEINIVPIVYLRPPKSNMATENKSFRH
jgi:hypothetical protein